MRIRVLLAVGSALAAPLAANSQTVSGPYVSLSGGTNLMDSQPYSYTNPPTQHGRFLFRPSYAGVVGLGYGFGNGLRVEIDGNFYRNYIHKQDDNFGGNIPMVGGVNTYGALFNAIYDIPVGFRVTPYVGGGGGYEVEDFLHLQNGLGDNYSGSYGSFAYDLIAGASYPIDQVPGLAVTAEYRFMQLTSTRKYNDAPGGSLINISGSSNDTFLVGLRYQLFNGAAPAPAPAPVAAPTAAPAPAAARTYLVFFDWDKYNLSSRATQIISQAAADSKTAATTTLDVSGYTDTSGTPKYNQALSERRAKAVAAQLVADGVPAGEIEIHGFGQTHLLVPTGPGVREPQNRRVEIVLH